jgi:hypothetical protein
MNRVTRVGLGILGVGIGLVFLKEMLAHYGGGGSGSGGSWLHPTPLPAALATAKHRPVSDSLTITLRPHAGSFDTVFTADVTIANESASSVRDVAISCDALGDNAATTGHATATLKDVFAPHATTTEANVQLPFIHRPTSVRCAIADFTIGP